MLHIRKFSDLGELNARLRDAGAADATLVNEVIGAACRRYLNDGKIGHRRTSDNPPRFMADSGCDPCGLFSVSTNGDTMLVSQAGVEP